MTHLPYILAGYGIFAVAVAWLTAGAGFRLDRAARRLRAIDPRARRTEGTDA